MIDDRGALVRKAVWIIVLMNIDDDYRYIAIN
jgi:hypothetical protein